MIFTKSQKFLLHLHVRKFCAYREQPDHIILYVIQQKICHFISVRQKKIHQRPGVGSPATCTLECKFLNPSTSAKPVMTKLQYLLVASVNIDIFQMTLKFSLFTVDLQV